MSDQPTPDPAVTLLQEVCRKYERITGSSVVGLGDTLRILASEDMRPEVDTWFAARLASPPEPQAALAEAWDQGYEAGDIDANRYRDVALGYTVEGEEARNPYALTAARPDQRPEGEVDYSETDYDRVVHDDDGTKHIEGLPFRADTGSVHVAAASPAAARSLLRRMTAPAPAVPPRVDVAQDEHYRAAHRAILALDPGHEVLEFSAVERVLIDLRDALAAAPGADRAGTTVVEWGVRGVGGSVYQGADFKRNGKPWRRGEAEAYIAKGERLMRRERTTFPDHVTPWREADAPGAGEVRGDG